MTRFRFQQHIIGSIEAKFVPRHPASKRIYYGNAICIPRNPKFCWFVLDRVVSQTNKVMHFPKHPWNRLLVTKRDVTFPCIDKSTSLIYGKLFARFSRRRKNISKKKTSSSLKYAKRVYFATLGGPSYAKAQYQTVYAYFSVRNSN